VSITLDEFLLRRCNFNFAPHFKKNLKSFQLWESHGAIWQHSVTRLSKIWANTYDEKFTPNKSEDELDFKLI
jgi:hypothetical protein